MTEINILNNNRKIGTEKLSVDLSGETVNVPVFIMGKSNPCKQKARNSFSEN